jgi:hypothetical protein
MSVATAGISEDALKLFARDLTAYAASCLQIRTKGGFDPVANEYRPAGQEYLLFNEEQKLINQMLSEQYKRAHRVRCIILKARQVGMSTYTSARFFRRMNLWPNQRAIVVADILTRAEELFGMYDRYAGFLPDELRPMVRYASKKKEMTFDNPNSNERSRRPGLQSSITVETAGDLDLGRGGTIQLAHLSEVASWDRAIEVYISLRQAVPDFESEIIIESTANGVGNFFHQMWLDAEKGKGRKEGDNGYLAVFFPWWSHREYQLRLTKRQRTEILNSLTETEHDYVYNGIEWRDEIHKLTPEQIGWRRWAIMEKTAGDERSFRQEYPATPDEAFLTSGAAFFDEDQLPILKKHTKEPKRRVFLVKPPIGGVMMQKNELGYLRVWELPRNKDPENNVEGGLYVIGADTATGKRIPAIHRDADDPEGSRERPDFSCADVIDVVTKTQVAQLHGRLSPEEFANQLYLLGLLYSSELPNGLRKPALLAVEKNHNSGETVLDCLKHGQPGRHGIYPNLYIPKYLNRRGGTKRTPYVGWLTTNETRQRMLDLFASYVRNFDPDNPDSLKILSELTVSEMLTFVRGMDGKPQAQEGTHDDTVMSMAITISLMAEEDSHQLPKNFERRTLWNVADSRSA